jgi:4-amino-4-deoxy-L-arabinose transferase-like glycosyltransferase
MSGIILICLGALYAILALHAAKFAYNAWLSVIFPGELEYGEGIVWQQAKLIPGPRMYGDLQQYPFLVFHYPPLFHVLANIAVWLGGSWLPAARTISILSLGATALLVGLFVMETSTHADNDAGGQPDPARHAPVVAAFVAGLLIFSIDPLRDWARIARVDMLACALEMLGMYLGLRALRRGGGLYITALVFVVALFAKQTVMTGAIATLLVALVYDWRRALPAAIVAGAFGTAAFLALTAVTNGGFARHLISYNINRFSLSDGLSAFSKYSQELVRPGYLLIALAGLCCIAVHGKLSGVQRIPIGERIVTIYFMLATAGLMSLGKSGASSNYFIPVSCATAMLAGVAVAYGARWAWRSNRYATGFAVLLVVLIAQSLAVKPVGEQRLTNPTYRREYQELLAMTRATGKPVFSENMVLLMEAGKEVPWEPSIITELSAKGVFDEQKIIALITARTFAFLAVNGTRDSPLSDTRYSPAVQAAFAKAYPVARVLAGERVLLPADQ